MKWILKSKYTAELIARILTTLNHCHSVAQCIYIFSLWRICPVFELLKFICRAKIFFWAQWVLQTWILLSGYARFCPSPEGMPPGNQLVYKDTAVESPFTGCNLLLDGCCLGRLGQVFFFLSFPFTHSLGCTSHN